MSPSLLSPPIAIDEVPAASLSVPMAMAPVWLAVAITPMAMAPVFDAVEFAPMAVALPAVAWASSPTAVALVPVALAALPTAVVSVAVALALAPTAVENAPVAVALKPQARRASTEGEPELAPPSVSVVAVALPLSLVSSRQSSASAGWGRSNAPVLANLNGRPRGLRPVGDHRLAILAWGEISRRMGNQQSAYGLVHPSLLW
jgi:hypothetical protein